MKISVVIPFYNEEKHIAEVVTSVSKYNLPIVVVDDGSVDASVDKIHKLKLRQVTIITHKINLGKGAAMKTGADFAFAKGADAIIFMDGDNQHKADDLSKFIAALESKRQGVIFGSRNYNYSVPLVRFLGNKFASLILVILFKIYVSDVLCGFKAFTKNAYNKIRWDSTGYGVETEMIARVGKAKIGFLEVPVQAIYHDKNKGVTILDAFGIFVEIIKWRLTI